MGAVAQAVAERIQDQLLLDRIDRELRVAAAATPLVIVLDDLHWADRGSLLALKLLARSLHDANHR